MEREKLEAARRQSAEAQEGFADFESVPRQSQAWKDADEEERKQGLPVKLADGTLKKVYHKQAAHAAVDSSTYCH